MTAILNQIPTHDTKICDLLQGHGDKGEGGEVFSSDPREALCC